MTISTTLDSTLVLSTPTDALPLPAATLARPRHKTFSVVGASIGLLIFVAVALLPALLYGGVVGAQLARGFLGAEGGATFGVFVLIALGIVSAVSTGAALFAAAGAALGALVGALTCERGSRA